MKTGLKKIIPFIIAFAIFSASAITLFTGCSVVDYVNDYKMTIVLNDDGKSVKCTSVIDIRCREDLADGRLPLIMNSAAFDNKLVCEESEIKGAYPKGESFGKVNVTSVLRDGKPIDYVLEDNILYAENHCTIKKGKKINLSIEYELQLPFTTLRYGYNDYSINLANFYPQYARVEKYYTIGDPFCSYADNYDVSIEYPVNMKALASGDMVDRQSDDKKVVDKYRAENCRDYAIVISNKYDMLTDNVNGITVNYMYFTDNSPQSTLNTAVNSIKVFSELFGKYQRKTFNVCETQFLQGGMEFSGLIFIANSTQGIDREIVTIHETAHQWWYDAVGSDQINHSWQDEGMTEFSVYLYYKENNESAKADEYVWSAKSNMQLYRETALKFNVPIDENMERGLDEFSNSTEYTYNTYVKGMLLFNYIYEVLGKEKFIDAMRAYLKENINKTEVQPEAMINEFEAKIKGISLIINAWLEGKITALN